MVPSQPRFALKPCALAIAAAFAGLPTHNAFGQQIVPDGRTQTTLAADGNVTDVFTATLRGHNAFNSFSKFDVYAGNVVNLHVPTSAANLLNLVHDYRTHIDGILNAIKDGRIGGNIYFANPHGMVVGSAGVVNVGALTVVTPTVEFMDGFFAGGEPSVDATTAMLTGTVPVSDSGLVVVRGRINTKEGVRIAAADVAISGTVATGALFVGVKPDFSDIVNIAGIENGAALVERNGVIEIVASRDIGVSGRLLAEGAHNLDGANVSLRAGRDIEVGGEALISASGRGEHSHGGEVIVFAGRDATLSGDALIRANGGEVSGDGGFVEFSAKRTVELAGGSLQAAAANGAAGAILIDPENLTISADLLRGPGNTSSEGIAWDAGSLTLTADDTLTVGANVVISTRSVADPGLRDSHVNGASTGASGDLTLAAREIALNAGSMLLAHAGGGHAAGTVTLSATGPDAGVLSDSVARIALSGATVKGGDIVLEAEAAGRHAGTFSPVVSKTVSATIDIDGSAIDAGGELHIRAAASLEATTPGFLPFGTVDADVLAAIDVRGASNLTASGGASLAASAQVDADIQPGLPDLGQGDFPVDAGVAIALIDSTATVDVRGSTTVDVAGAFRLSAINTVDITAIADASASGGSAVGGTLALSVLDTTTRAAIGEGAEVTRADGGVGVSAQSVNTVVAQAKAAAGGAQEQGSSSRTEQALADYQSEASTSDGGVTVAAAVAVSDLESLTQAYVSSSAPLAMTGALSVSGRSLNQAEVAADGSSAEGGVGVGVGVALNLATITNEAYVGQAVNAAGVAVEALMADAAEPNRFATSAISGAAASNVGVAGALALNVIENRTRALVTAGSIDAGGGNVTLAAENRSEAEAKALPADGGTSGDSFGLGASVAVHVATNETRAAVEDGGAIESANDITLSAAGSHAATVEAQAGAEGGIGLAPVVAVAVVDNTTTARFGTGDALVLAGELSVSATHSGSTTVSASADTVGDKAAIGAAVAISVIHDAALATTARAVGSTGGGIAFIAHADSTSAATAKASAKGGREDEDGDTQNDGVDREIGSQLALGKDRQAAGSNNAGQQPASAETAGDGEGGGNSKLSVAAAIAVNVAESRAEALVPDGRNMNAGGGELRLSASNNTDASASADGAAVGDAAVGIGAGVAINVATSVNSASLGAGLHSGEGVTVEATMTDTGDTVSNFGAEASSGGGSSKVGIAGSLALNIVDHASSARIAAGATVDAGAGDVRIEAENRSESKAKALPSEDATASGEKVGIGASVAVNVVANESRAELADGATLNGGRNLTVAATGSHMIETEAEAGSEGGISVTPVAAVTVSDNQTVARLGGGNALDLRGEVTVSATHSAAISTSAKGSSQGEKASIGIAVGVTVAHDSALATTDRDIAQADGEVRFLASAAQSTDTSATASAKGGKEEDENTPEDGVDRQVQNQASFGQSKQKSGSANQGQQTESAQSSEGKVSVAAAVAVNVAESRAQAFIPDARTVGSDGALTVQASNNTDARAAADGSAAGSTATVGIGAAVSVNKATALSEAYIGAATVNAQGVAVRSVMTDVGGDDTNTFSAEARAGAGGGKVGIAGALALNLIDVSSTAEIRAGADVDAKGGDVELTAESRTSTTASALPDGPASGGKVGVGASVALNLFSRDLARARIGENATLDNAGALSLSAVSASDTKAEAEAGAAGSIAVDAVVAFSEVRQTTEAVIASGDAIAAGGAVSLSATATGSHEATATGDVKSDKVGVGASAAVIVSGTQTRAAVERDLSAGAGADDHLSLVASATRSYEAVATAGAGGGKADDELSQQEKDNAKSTSTLKDTEGAQKGTEKTGSGSKVNVAAAAGVLVIDDDVQASIAAGRTVSSGGDITVGAYNSSDFSARGLGDTLNPDNPNLQTTVGIGIGVGLSIVRNDTVASIGDGVRVIEAGDITVSAESVQNRSAEFISKLAAEAISGAGAEKAAVAGSLAVANSNSKTHASIGDGVVIENAGAVNIDTQNTSRLSAKAWSGAVSQKVGVGASVAIIVSENEYRAWLGDNADATVASLQVSARNLEVSGTVPFDLGLNDDFTLDSDFFAEKFKESNLQLLVGENNYYTEAVAGAAGGQVAVSGAFAINIFDDTTEAYIGDDAQVTSSGAVALEARNDVRSKALAGAVGVGKNAGIGLNTADIINSGTTSAWLGDGARIVDASSVSIDAGASQDFGVFGVSLGAANTAGIAGVLALVVSDNEVAAYTGAGSGVDSRGDVRIAADNRYDSITVAGGAAGGSTAGVGASASTNVVNSLTRAEIGEGARVDAAGTTSVTASAAEDALTIAIAGGAASTAGVGAGVAVNVINPGTVARIGADAAVNQTTLGGEVVVEASDDTRLLTIAGGLGAAGTAGVGAGVDVGILTKRTEAIIADDAQVRAAENVRLAASAAEDILSVGASAGAASTVGLAGAASGYAFDNYTGAHIGGGATVHSIGNVSVAAQSDTEMTLVAGGAGLGGTAGIGASVTVMVMEKTTEAYVGDGARVTALGAGSGGIEVATGSFDIGFADYDPTKSTREVQAPSFGDDADGTDGDLLNRQRSSTRDTREMRGLAVTATSRDDIKTVSVAATAAGTLGLSVGGNVMVLASDVSAYIDANARINENNTGAHRDQSVMVAAGNDLYHLGITGNVAGAGTVGIGAGADVAVIDYSTQAFIGSHATVNTRRDVDVVASAREDLVSVSAAGGISGTVGVSGAVGAIVLDTRTHAYIGADATVDADGNVRVAASDETEIVMVAGSLGIGFGAAGVGGSVGVVVVDKDTQAYIGTGATVNARGGLASPPAGGALPGGDDGAAEDPESGNAEGIDDPLGSGGGEDPQQPVEFADDGTADMIVYTGDTLNATTSARGLLVEASSKEDVTVVSVAGGGGFYAGVAGAVSVESIRSQTQAYIGANAKINTANDNANLRQDVNVTARNDASLFVVDGAIGVGFAGVGGSVDVGLIRNSTAAYIGDGAEVHAMRDVDVNALSRKNIRSIVVSGAGGVVGVAAGVGVYSVGAALDQDALDRLKKGDDADDTAEDGAPVPADANSYADQQASSGAVTDVLGSFGESRLAGIGASAGAARADIGVSGDLTAAPPSGNSAYIANGAQVHAGRHVDIDARERVDFNLLAGAAAVGAVGVGAGVGVATFSNSNQAFIGADAIVSAGAVDPDGDVSVTAQLVSDAKTESYAGSGGLVAVDASVAVISDSSSVTAFIGDRAQVLDAQSVHVEASDGRNVRSYAFGAGVGAATAGASVATTTVAGSVSASVGEDARIGQGGGEVGDVIVEANSTASAHAEAQTARGGIGLAVSGTVATATARPTVSASVERDARIAAQSGVLIAAVAQPLARAEALGVNVAGGVSVGASVATARSAPDVTVRVYDGARIDGGGLTVFADNRPQGSGPGAYANALGASGGLLAGVNATVAEAESEARVRALVDAGVRLPDGNVLVRANNISRQEAYGQGYSLAGIFAAGANVVTAESANTTQARLGSGAITGSGRGGDIFVIAEGHDSNAARSEAGTGGLIAGNASTAFTSDVSSVSAAIGGGTTLYAGNVVVDAQHNDNFAPSADSLNASAFGASGAFAGHNATSNVAASLGGNLTIHALGDVVVAARNVYQGFGGERASAAAGGVATGAAAFSQTTLGGSARVEVGDHVRIDAGTDPVLNPGSIEFVSSTFLNVDEKVTLATGGLLAGAVTRATLSATMNNVVDVGSNHRFTSLGHFGAGTYSQAFGTASALVNTWGAASVGSATATSTLTSNQTVNIGASGHIEAFGNVDLTAGRDPLGYFDTMVAATSSAQGYVYGIIAVPDAQATSVVTSNSALSVGNGTVIRSGLNTTLAAYRGSPLASADGTGRGYQLGFIPVEQKDSTTTVLGTSLLSMNGAATAGIYNTLDLTIPDCRNAGPGNLFCNQVVAEPGSAPFLWTFDGGFQANPFIQELLGQGSITGDFFAQGVSSTPVGATLLGTLFAAGGTVTLHGNVITGNGSVTARGGPEITVRNQSPNYLVLGEVRIPNTSGGRVIFTGAAGAAQAGGLTITQIKPGQGGVVNIHNSFPGAVGTTDGNYGPAMFLTGTIDNLGGLVAITNDTGSLLQTATVFGQQVVVTVPQGVFAVERPGGIFYAGASPYAEWMNYMIWPGGDPRLGTPDANHAAAWVANYEERRLRGADIPENPFATATLNARLYGFAGDSPPNNESWVYYGACAAFARSAGVCTQAVAQSLSPIGGAYRISNSDFNHRWFPLVPWVPLERTAASYASANLAQSAGSGQILGNQVLITAKYIDLNATIRAGQATDWSVSLPSSLTGIGGAIWAADLAFQFGGVDKLVSLPGVRLSTTDVLIPAYYDPRTRQILLDSVSASAAGGSITLIGEMISTNPLGSINVNGGLGTVRVDNHTGRELVVQNVNTGNVDLSAAITSTVKIVDNRQPLASRQWLYEYSAGQGLKVYNGPGNVTLTEAHLVPTQPTGASAVFSPQAGLRWQWQLQAGLNRTIFYDSDGRMTNISGWNWTDVHENNPWRYRNMDTGALSVDPVGRLIVDPGKPVFHQEITAPFASSGWTWSINYHGCGSGSICNYGFRRTGTYPSGHARAGEGFANWLYRYRTSATLRMTQSVKADNPVSIDFTGKPEALFTVNSNAPVVFAGQVSNPNGQMSVVAGGSILAASGGSISTGNVTLAAAGAIGAANAPLLLSLADNAVLNASGGSQGVFLDINSNARIGAVTSQTGTDFGDVVIRATNNLLSANAALTNATGRNVTLVSELGSIGSVAVPFAVSAKPVQLLSGAVSGGVTGAQALSDIALEHRNGNLLVGRIESTGGGDVLLRVPAGTILSAAGQTAAQALSPEQVQQIWADLKLTAALGAEQFGDPNAKSVIDFQNRVNNDYLRYTTLLALGQANEEGFVLNESSIALLRPQAAAVLGIASPDDAQVRGYAQQLYAGLYASLDDALSANPTYGSGWAQLPLFQSFDDGFAYLASTAQVENLTKNAVWTEGELRHAINRTALEPASGAPVGVGEPNVIGRNVRLETAGAIGKLADPVFISLADLRAGTLTAEQAAALALAVTPGDVLAVGEDALGNRVTFEFDSQPAGVTLTGFQIEQTAPLFVDVTGGFSANAGGVAYVQSAGQVLALDQILAGGNVSLAAPDSILGNPGNDFHIRTPGDLILLAGSGSLGASGNPLVVDLGGTLLSASASQNLYLQSFDGDLDLGRVFAGQTAWLSAQGGGIFSTLPGIDIHAHDIMLTAQGDIGRAADALQIEAEGTLEGAAEGSAWLFAPNRALDIGRFAADAGLSIVAAQALDADELESRDGDLDVSAGTHANIGAVEAGGAVALSALADLSVGSAGAGATLDLLAGGDVSMTGTFSSGGAAQVQASGAIDMQDGAALDAGAASIRLQAGDDIRLGRVATTGAADVVITSDNGVVLDAGDAGGVDIDAPNAMLVIRAAGGIGADDAIETNVAALDAVVSGAGGMRFADAGAIDLVNLETADGPITVDAGGALIARHVVAGNADVSLTTSAGDIGAGLVSAVGGDALLDAEGSIYEFADGDAAKVIARGMTLTARTGKVGDEDAWLRIDSSNDAPGVVNASGAQGVWLFEVDGGLNAGLIASSGGDLHVTADGSILRGATGLNLAGGNFELRSLGSSIGAPGERLVMDSGGVVNAEAFGGIYLEETWGDLESGRMATEQGSIDILIAAGDGRFGQVLAPDDVTIVAQGSLLSIDLLDPQTTTLQVTQRGGSLLVGEMHVSDQVNVLADNVWLPDVQGSPAGTLRFDVRGGTGGIADSVGIYTYGAPVITFDRLWTRNAGIQGDVDYLNFYNSIVLSRATLQNRLHTVEIDNVNRVLYRNADAQLYTGNVPFYLEFFPTRFIRTSAWIVNYKDDFIVNEFSTENSMTRAVPKFLAIAEQEDETGREEEPREDGDILVEPADNPLGDSDELMRDPDELRVSAR